MTNNGAVVLSFIWIALFGFSSTAQGESNIPLKTNYEVTVGGITVLDIKYRLEISRGAYQSRVEIETRGVATILSDYQMKMAVSGSFANDRAQGAEYTSRRKKKDKTKSITLDWSSNSPSPSEGRFSKHIEASLTPASADPLTAILRIGMGSMESPCRTTQRIYDGREVFDLRFKFVKQITADDGWPGAYRGPAFECRLTYLPVAGKAAQKFKEEKEEAPIYSVWLAPVTADVPGASLLIPVRAEGVLDGLSFVAYASRAEIGGRPFNQDSAAAVD